MQGLRATLEKTTKIGKELPKQKRASISATLKYALSSPKKMELAAKLVRGKNAQEAQRVLKFAPLKSAKILLKVLNSALANAKNNAWVEVENLIVKRVDIGRGPKILRIRPVSRGRAHRYVKHRSLVRVVLDIK